MDETTPEFVAPAVTEEDKAEFVAEQNAGQDETDTPEAAPEANDERQF